MGEVGSFAVMQDPVRPSSEASKITERVALMSSSPLFAGLSEDEIKKIASLARPRSFARDEMLYMQGQPLRNLALIRSGSVKITQVSSKGSEVILWMYGCGGIVGLLSEPTASNQNPCTACAMEHCTALVWDHRILQDLMVKFPQIRKNASQILAARLNELEERFREVATEKVAKRLSLALLRLLKQVGKVVEGGVEVSLSRDELAQMTGTTLFTISRILSKWADMGFISPRREAVLVRDQSRLELVGNEE